MPFGGNSFDAAKMVSYREMLAKIAERFPDRNVIRLLDGPNSTSKVFFVFKIFFNFTNVHVWGGVTWNSRKFTETEPGRSTSDFCLNILC